MRLVLLVLVFVASIASAEPLRFGYFHTDEAGLEATRDHTNLVAVLTADPETVSLERAAELHQTAQIVLEFGALKLSFLGQNGCTYNKCMSFDAARVAAILDAVEDGIVLVQSRIHSFYIADEPETNPPTLAAIKLLIDAIKDRPTLRNIPLWINYDNVYEGYTGTPFVLSDEVDFVSLTPTYGAYCWYQLCETSRYATILDAVAEHNRAATLPTRVMVVGDGWAKSPDTDGFNTLSSVGKSHLYKVNALYDGVIKMADARGIEVAGEVVFSYSTPGEYTVARAPAAIKDKWRDAGNALIDKQAALVTTPVETPTTTPVKTPVKTPWGSGNFISIWKNSFSGSRKAP